MYYEFWISTEGIYTFTTCAAETFDDYFDTRLLILDTDCETILYSNDNNCGGAYTDWSTITTCLLPGHYYLVVSSAGNEDGSFQLDCYSEGECTPCNPPECPDWGIDEVEPNNGTDDNPPTYDNIAPGETHCGALSHNGYTLDSDWYQFTVDDMTQVEFFLDGEESHSLVLSLIDESSGSPVMVANGVTQDHCVDYILNSTLTGAGRWSVRVSYEQFSPDDVSSSYTLTWIDPDAVQAPVDLPSDFHLSQNHPNPFNPSTTIEFTLPHSQEIQLVVYNIQGQRVAILAEGMHAAGLHQVTFDTNVGAYRNTPLPSGLYFYMLQSENYRTARKMILVR